MTDNHPITPPPELVEEWANAAAHEFDIATQAAQWGSDQELEACCKWFQEFYKTETWVDLDLKTFRAARRPKPPSLKERALEAWEECWGSGFFVQKDSFADTIRRALEQLDD